MGTFQYTIEIGDAQQQGFRRVDAWVDSGATYTWLPRGLLEELGYVPVFRRQFRLADGSVVKRDLCWVPLRLDGEVQPTPCVFGDEGSQALLGALTLDALSLGIDPVNRRLVPVIANALSARAVEESREMLLSQARAARAASRSLARTSTRVKNRALLRIAEALEQEQEAVLEANRVDCQAGREAGLAEAMLDRLLLTPQRLSALAADVRKVAALPDPVGESFDARTLPNGLRIARRRVPLGVIGAIYESRPNVTVDISVLCLKSGNAALLRGGREAIHSNVALANLVREAIAQEGVPRDAVQLVQSTDRALVGQMLAMKEHIDLIIPRGGADLIRLVAEQAQMPAITGGIGVCHTYIDGHADPEKAVAIAYNAKVQRPTVCNALDTLLVHVQAAPTVLPAVARAWAGAGVEVRCDRRALSILGSEPDLDLRPASDDDWGKEFLSLVAAVRVVDSLDEALGHIERYGSGHSEAIVTEDYGAAMRFLDEVDAAAVFVNASTRFTDGGQFGLGAEVAISTNKMHARGPMGLRELTSYKWTVMGTGQVRE